MTAVKPAAFSATVKNPFIKDSPTPTPLEAKKISETLFRSKE
jgi:hypothetical protein